MYVQVSPECISMAGERVGITNLPANVTRALAEDVSYRTREVANLAALFLRHSRKRKLTTDDMNLALKWSDVDQVLGQGGTKEVSVSQLYTPVPELDLFVDVDTDIDLVDSSVTDTKPLLEQEIKLSVSASWLHVEGGGDTVPPSGHLLQYYNAVVTCTLGESENLCAKMMRDVSSNSKISPLLTYIITFIRHVMKRFQNKTKLQTRMLRLISAIFSNPHLNLSPKPYLSHLVTALLETVLCNNISAVTQVTFASTILSLALSRWATPVNQLKCQTLNHLRDVVNNPNAQGLKQYGALTCLTLLGPKLLCDSLYPWPGQLWSQLDAVTKAQTEVSSLLASAVRRAAASIINHWLEEDYEGSPNWKFYGEVYQYFGDSLIPQLKYISRDFKVKKLPRTNETYGRMKLRKVQVLNSLRTKNDHRRGDDTNEIEPILTASQNFEFLADMGVPSDIFDEPVSSMDFSDALGDTRPSYNQQQSTTSTFSNSRHVVISRTVKELFPEVSPVKRNKAMVIQLPLIPSTNRPRRVTGGLGDNTKYNCVQWRHLVTGGRMGTKYRRMEGSKINRIPSYIDIVTNVGI